MERPTPGINISQRRNRKNVFNGSRRDRCNEIYYSAVDIVDVVFRERNERKGTSGIENEVFAFKPPVGVCGVYLLFLFLISHVETDLLPMLRSSVSFRLLN